MHYLAIFFYASQMSVFFFFFQAEDGIRDIGVTGVQTCALPIFTEAVLMADVLPTAQFVPWFSAYLPGLRSRRPLFEPAVVADSSDGQTAHLHGQIGRASCRERV